MASTYVALPDLEAAPLQDGAIVFCPSNGKFLMLNRSASLIWTELAKPRTADELVLAICAKFPDADAVTAKSDVAATVAQLSELGMIATTG
jgi:hypothetical protein